MTRRRYPLMILSNQSRNHRYPLINRLSTRRPWQSCRVTRVRGSTGRYYNNRRSSDFERFVLTYYALKHDNFKSVEVQGRTPLKILIFLYWTLRPTFITLLGKRCGISHWMGVPKNHGKCKSATISLHHGDSLSMSSVVWGPARRSIALPSRQITEHGSHGKTCSALKFSNLYWLLKHTSFVQAAHS